MAVDANGLIPGVWGDGKLQNSVAVDQLKQKKSSLWCIYVYIGICLPLCWYSGTVFGEHKCLWHPKNTWKVPLLQRPSFFAAATLWTLFVFVPYVLRDNAGFKDSMIVLATVFITTYPTRPSGTIKKARLCCVVWSVLQRCELFSWEGPSGSSF